MIDGPGKADVRYVPGSSLPSRRLRRRVLPGGTGARLGLPLRQGPARLARAQRRPPRRRRRRRPRERAPRRREVRRLLRLLLRRRQRGYPRPRERGHVELRRRWRRYMGPPRHAPARRPRRRALRDPRCHGNPRHRFSPDGFGQALLLRPKSDRPRPGSSARCPSPQVRWPMVPAMVAEDVSTDGVQGQVRLFSL